MGRWHSKFIPFPKLTLQMMRDISNPKASTIHNAKVSIANFSTLNKDKLSCYQKKTSRATFLHEEVHFFPPGSIFACSRYSRYIKIIISCA